MINSSFGILDYNNAPQFGTKSVAEDEREYEDDFESEIPGTNENADEKKILFDDVKAELTTVEQIMQRWYQAPPQSSTPIITHEDGNDLLKLEANRVVSSIKLFIPFHYMFPRELILGKAVHRRALNRRKI